MLRTLRSVIVTTSNRWQLIVGERLIVTLSPLATCARGQR